MYSYFLSVIVNCVINRYPSTTFLNACSRVYDIVRTPSYSSAHSLIHCSTHSKSRLTYILFSALMTRRVKNENGDSFTLFFTMVSPFSNFHPCSFIVSQISLVIYCKTILNEIEIAKVAIIYKALIIYDKLRQRIFVETRGDSLVLNSSTCTYLLVLIRHIHI